jgi:YD repeat-containing protein
MDLTGKVLNNRQAACMSLCNAANAWNTCTGKGTLAPVLECTGIYLSPQPYADCALVHTTGQESTDYEITSNCPSHSSLISGKTTCICDTGYFESNGRCVPMPPKNFGCCQGDDKPQIGNPIGVGTGNKVAQEIDYTGQGPFPLQFARVYNARDDKDGIIGYNWRIFSALTVSPTCCGAQINRPDGRVVNFTSSGNGVFVAEADGVEQLSQVSGGWKLKTANDETETFDSNGNLLSITNRFGLTQTLTYSDGTTGTNGGYVLDQSGNATRQSLPSGLPLRLTDPTGRLLLFGYDASARIVKMTDPSGGVYRYQYDAHNNLTKVIYPDGKSRSYLYENTTYVHALTGIVDENNIRYATYAYDGTGRATSTEHAGGVDKYTVVITNNTDGSTSSIVTDANGVSKTYNGKIIVGALKNLDLSQPGGSGYGSATATLSYDGSGNIQVRTDFNGNVTTYTYDSSRNLETKRVEASGTAQARTISTQWHATYRLPVKVAEPMKVTTYTYDNHGNLTTKTEQATSDVTGVQGVNATAVGAIRTWTYTYNQYGQVLTAVDPLGNTTTYAYDAQGNLSTITNALNQATTLSNYDANGRVGRIVDPNGLVTDLTYAPRGWLTSKTVTAPGITETTRYDYDGVGQLTKVTLPDGAFLAYTYDDAHRLTDVADGAGNAIHYTLDLRGNRTVDEVRDPGGVLTRRISRVFDSLSRLQQITGGVQ